MQPQENIIKNGMKVILKKDGSLKCQVIDSKRKTMFEKKNFSLAASIGHPFGSEWELSNNQIVLVNREGDNSFVEKMEDSALDNRSLVDNAESQKLQEPDISKMKQDGVTGGNIIEKLVDNSATFKNKTIYSKEKYLKKKKNKHLVRFTILKPTTRLVCEAFFSKAPTRVIPLRVDILAQMLASTNVQSSSKVLVIENCQGVLVASVMERLSGIGSIVQLHTEQDPVHNAIQAFNFPSEYHSVLHTFHLRRLGPEILEASKEGLMMDTSEETDVEAVTDVKVQQEGDSVVQNNDQKAKENEVKVDADGETAAQNKITKDDLKQKESEVNQQRTGVKRKHDMTEEREVKLRKRKEDDEKVKKLLEAKNMDALLIASRFDPTELACTLIDFLAPSRPFAVFNSCKEPLLETFQQLKKRGDVMNVRLSETWLRQYQVLPERTHPHVIMNGTGGYLLTGTRVAGD